MSLIDRIDQLNEYAYSDDLLKQTTASLDPETPLGALKALLRHPDATIRSNVKKNRKWVGFRATFIQDNKQHLQGWDNEKIDRVLSTPNN